MARKHDGCAKLMNQYNEHNRHIKAVCLDVDGTPTANIFGYATVQVTYDEHGIMQLCAYSNASGQPVEPRGKVEVTSLLENSQAQRLGLRVGDVITAYNQTPINTACDLTTATNIPGDELQTLTVVRAGELLTFQVQPGRLGIEIAEVAVEARERTR